MLVVLVLGFSFGPLEESSVALKAVDADGRPAFGAAASTLWVSSFGRMNVSSIDAAKCDRDGRALIQTTKWAGRKAVLVLSADEAEAAIVGVGREHKDKEVGVRLQPSIQLKGKFTCKELETMPAFLFSSVSLDGFKNSVAQDNSTSASFEFRLPPGKYTLFTYGEGVESAKQVVTLAPGETTHDMGTIELKADKTAKLKGKPAPELSITAARGVKPGLKMGDLKGKWVYLEFWGYWCGPCIISSLPELMEISEKHAELREKFFVLTIHEKALTSFEDLDKKLPAVKERHWKGKDLTLPVLLDTTGTMEKQYGINAFPTGIMIDPEGNVVGRASPAQLGAILRNMGTSTKDAPKGPTP